MGVYSRNQTTTQTPQEKPQVASKDLSTVIIESFDSVKEQLTEEQEEFDETEPEKGDSDIIKSLLKNNLEKQDDLLNLLIKDETENSKKGQLTTEKPNEFQALLEKENQGVVESSQPKTISSDVRRNEFQGLLESKQQRDADAAKNNAKEAKAESSRNKQTNLLNLIGKGISTIVSHLAKAALIVVALSQAIVLVKAGWAWLQNYIPVGVEKLTADIQAGFESIPGRIMLEVRKHLQGTTLGSMMGLGGLDKEERAELKDLKKTQDVKSYRDKREQAYLAMNQIGKNMALTPDELAEMGLGGDVENFELTDENIAKLREKQMAQLHEKWNRGEFSDMNQFQEAVEQVDAQTSNLLQARTELTQMESNSPDVERFRELERRKSGKLSEDEYQAELSSLKSGTETRSQELFLEKSQKDYEKGIHSTETQAKMRADIMGTDVDTAKALITGTTAEDYVAKGKGGELRGDKYLRNEFADWTRAWEQLAHNLKQNIGLRVEQLPPKNAERNPTSCR